MATETKRAKLSTADLIPDFRLSAVNRDGQVGPGDYKQHRNLVLVFLRTVECLECKQLLREISENYDQYQEKEAEVLAIATDDEDRLRQLAEDLALPFPLLSDSDGTATNLYLKHKEQSEDRAAFEAAIFVADRWGAIFSAISIEKTEDLPAEAEIREWLEFIELQCEECFPAEWPLREDDRVLRATNNR